MMKMLRRIGWWIADTAEFVKGGEWYPESNPPVRLMSSCQMVMEGILKFGGRKCPISNAE